MSVGDLVINLHARTERFTRGMNSARKSVGGFVSSAVTGFARVGAAAATLGATMGAALGVKSIGLAANAEQTAVSFEVLTGSAETAQKLITDLRTMGASTPFQVTDLNKAAETLMAFGATTDTVMDDITMLSNVAKGDSEKLKSLALVFGQISANGRLTGQDLLQMVNTGFNPLKTISEQTGESVTSLREKMSKGLISFEDVREAFRAATSEGGRFYNMNIKQSLTLLGKWSTLKDNVTEALREIGVALIEELDMAAAIDGLTDFARSFKTEWIPQIREGIRKAADIGRMIIEVFTKIGEVIDSTARKIMEMQLSAAQFREAVGLDKNENSLIGVTVDQIQSEIKERDLLARIQKKEFGQVEKISQEEAMRRFGSGGGMGFNREQSEIEQFIEEQKKLKEKEEKAFKEEAKRIADSVKTPMERFVEETAKLDQMVMKGLISPEVYQRAIAAEEEKVGWKDDGESSVRSLEAGSREAFEVLRASRKSGGKDITKQQLDQAKMQTKELKFITKELKKRNTNTDTRSIEVRDID